LETREAVNESSRRRFFQMALRGTLAGLVTATGIEFADPRPVMAQSKLSPDAALQDLIEGNRRSEPKQGSVIAVRKDSNYVRSARV